MTSTEITPPESDEAVSILSVRRDFIPSFITRRSTIISILCFLFLSSFMSSESSYILPSILTRTYPERLACSSSFAYVPFRPLTMGAISCILVPASSSDILSTIWSTVCCFISRPQTGQCGIPILAYNRRR